MASRVVFHRSALGALQAGDVTRDVARRARNVESLAKQLCRVDTGRLRSSITSGVFQDRDAAVGWCGSDVEYAEFVPAQGQRRGAIGGEGWHYLQLALRAAKD